MLFNRIKKIIYQNRDTFTVHYRMYSVVAEACIFGLQCRTIIFRCRRLWNGVMECWMRPTFHLSFNSYLWIHFGHFSFLLSNYFFGWILIFTNGVWSTQITMKSTQVCHNLRLVKLTIKKWFIIKFARIIGCLSNFMGPGPSYLVELTEIFQTSLRFYGLKFSAWKSKWWRFQRKNVLLCIIKCIPMCFWVCWLESHSHIEAYNPSVLKNGCMLGVSSDIWFKKCDITSPTMWHKFVTRLHCTS